MLTVLLPVAEITRNSEGGKHVSKPGKCTNVKTRSHIIR